MRVDVDGHSVQAPGLLRRTRYSDVTRRIPSDELAGLQEERPVDAVRVAEGGRVAHELLEPVVAHVSAPAVQLERLGDHRPRGLRGKHLRQRAQRRVPAAFLVVALPGRVMDVRARGVDQHAHFGKLRRDHVVLDQAPAPLHALLRPAQRSLVRRVGHAEDAGRRIGVAGRKELREHVEPAADRAEHILVGHEARIEQQLGVVGQPLAHLVVDAADREPGRPPFDQEARAAFDEALRRDRSARTADRATRDCRSR